MADTVRDRRTLRPAAGLVATLALLVGACTSAASPVPAPSATAAQPSAAPSPVGNRELILATTTSTRDSGLLDVLLPDFEARTGYAVKMLAVGSGQALELGQEGNVDVLLVHSPAAEKAFVEAGHGIDRRLVMHNDFIIVGPEADRAGIAGLTSASEALARIAAAKATFVSRGDGSGTETKELALWKAAGITPEGAWYLQSGQPMGATLTITSEKGGYTLSDRATYLAFSDQVSLDILLEGDPVLLNVYSVIRVNPDSWPKVNAAGALAFADYLVSPEGQALIGAFGVQEYGQALFVPDAGKDEGSLP